MCKYAHNTLYYIISKKYVLYYLSTGQLQIIADIEFIFGNATASVTVMELSGRARLSFRKFPVTHFTFSFLEEPFLSCDVDTVVLGRTVPQLNAIVVSQIRRVIRKKHVLPAVKIRFKPLFMKPEDHPKISVSMFSHPLNYGDLRVQVLGVRTLYGVRDGLLYTYI